MKDRDSICTHLLFLLAASAALYLAMSVGLSVGLSVGRYTFLEKWQYLFNHES